MMRMQCMQEWDVVINNNLLLGVLPQQCSSQLQ